MSATSALKALALGNRPDGDALLSTCRYECRGGDTIGQEAIWEAMALEPLAGASDAQAIATPMGLALIGSGDALFADLYGDYIGRLWRIGGGSCPGEEPALDVPFDPDLHQRRGDVLFRGADHPLLDAAGCTAAEAAAHMLLDAARGPGLHRVRLFVLRVVADAGSMAVLASVHRLAGGTARQGGFGFGLVSTGNRGVATIVDPLWKRAWTPRL